MKDRAPFSSAQVKIARASRLLSDLEREIEQFDGAALVAEQEMPGRVVWTVRYRHNPRDEWAAASGDIIHNLRSALDHVAVSTVIANGGNPADVYFPFATSETALQTQIRKKNFHRASPDAIELLHKFRPYRGGTDPLRALHDLDVVDKHRDLISLAGTVTQQVDMRIGGTILRRNRFDLVDGHKAISCPGEGASLLRPLPLKVQVFFRNAPAFAGEEVTATLRSLLGLTSQVMGAFKTLSATAA